MPWLFLFAYTCSGLAGLVYEVSWTRLLTLQAGHTTATTSTVVGAFLGGLAVGAAWGGRVASGLSRRAALRLYVALELGVVVVALLLPFVLRMATPLLSRAYGDGDASLPFLVVRVGLSLLLMFVPAAALGATFPMAIRWFAGADRQAARASSLLYAVNTAGAAGGALLAGFVLIPSIGLSGATWVGIGASLAAAAAVGLVLWQAGEDVEADSAPEEAVTPTGDPSHTAARKPSPDRQPHVAAPPAVDAAGHAMSDVPRRGTRRGRAVQLTPADPPPAVDYRWLAALVLGLSGFASLMHEIAWTRVLALVLGPTTYAFAATLAAVITGVALGSAGGVWLTGRVRQPAAWLTSMLALGAASIGISYALAGRWFPSLVAQLMATADDPFAQLLRQGLLLTAALIIPTAACLGAAFPLALALTGADGVQAPRRFGVIYAINTVGAVSGSLAAGFVFIPLFGLEVTLQAAAACLVAAALLVAWRGPRQLVTRALASGGAVAVAIVGVASPPWDRALLASGPYMYAPFVPEDLDLETMLKAGTLLYYREGASATVTVKQLTGTTTMAVDGKVDASNRGDMLTQKVIAHLPLLLHDRPEQVVVIGLGSGVTAGAALTHPVSQVDVIEIAPEVVEASRFFEQENRHALADPRTRLIVGDGRSHLLLTSKPYDVIISEPSNPWIAGVAALFTREFFEGAKSRLAPGGIFCQWANAYNIGEADLRSIVATFLSAFPHGTVWLVGADDVLMLASDEPVDDRLARMAANWTRPGVADDLARVSVFDPFSLLSLYVGGPTELTPYAAGMPLFVDDTMRLEFSAPRELHSGAAGINVTRLSALASDDTAPPAVRDARARAGVTEWRNRGLMMARSDVHGRAYDDFKRALEADVTDMAALDGFVRAALLTGQSPFAVEALENLSAGRPAHPNVLVALSKARAAAGLTDEALATATEASRIDPAGAAGLEQLATLLADRGDTVRLDNVVEQMKLRAPDAAATHYFAAVAAFLHGDAEAAARSAEAAIAADASYAPVYDLVGAAYTRLGRVDEARAAFERSLTFDAHDSTAYTNLGLLALEEGRMDAARGYFAEALWLAPESATAREGLARSRR